MILGTDEATKKLDKVLLEIEAPEGYVAENSEAKEQPKGARRSGRNVRGGRLAKEASDLLTVKAEPSETKVGADTELKEVETVEPIAHLKEAETTIKTPTEEEGVRKAALEPPSEPNKADVEMEDVEVKRFKPEDSRAPDSPRTEDFHTADEADKSMIADAVEIKKPGRFDWSRLGGRNTEAGAKPVEDKRFVVEGAVDTDDEDETVCRAAVKPKSSWSLGLFHSSSAVPKSSSSLLTRRASGSD